MRLIHMVDKHATKNRDQCQSEFSIVICDKTNFEMRTELSSNLKFL